MREFAEFAWEVWMTFDFFCRIKELFAKEMRIGPAVADSEQWMQIENVNRTPHVKVTRYRYLSAVIF